MKLAELTAAVVEETGVSKRDAKKVVDALFAHIKAAVDGGEKVAIPDLGSFVLKEREAGESVNAKTGAVREVSAARYISFKPNRVASGKARKTPRTKGEKSGSDDNGGEAA